MKGWSLVNKNTGKIIKISFTEADVYVVAFETKKGLLEAVGGKDAVEHDEAVRRVEVTVKGGGR